MTPAKAAAAEEAIEVIGGDLFESGHAITRAWPLEAIIESPLNPRRHYDPRAMEELVRSLQRTGQITPGLARPVPGSTIEWQGNHYQVVELAAGHRRFRALSTMGEQTMRLEIRDMADEDFIEVISVENLQRDNLDPMEEADGYRLLMDRTGYDVGRVADRVGRARSYVYDRLRLLQLVPEAQDWLREGRILLGHAVALSRLGAEQQRRVIGGPERDYRQGGLWAGEYLPGLLDPDREMPRTNQAGAPGYPLDPGDVEWSNGDIAWDTYMDVPAATSVVAIHLSILRWTAWWETKVQEKLAEHEAQWRREQEAAAPGKKATKPKKLAGDDLLSLIREELRNYATAVSRAGTGCLPPAAAALPAPGTLALGPRAGPSAPPGVEAARGRTTRAVRAMDEEGNQASSPGQPVPASSDESIRRLLEEGKTVKEVAQIAGLSTAAVYARRKKLGISGKAAVKTDGVAAAKPTFRCRDCLRVGQDPKRCEHCFEFRGGGPE